MKIPSLLALLCLIYSHVRAQDSPSILIGKGGGITGIATVYHITPSGKVFKGQGVTEINYTECGKIKRARAKKMISQVATTVAGKDFNHPGNVYYFLTLKESEGEKKLTWGDADHNVPEPVKVVFDEIQKAISDIKYRPIKSN